MLELEHEAGAHGLLGMCLALKSGLVHEPIRMLGVGLTPRLGH